MAKADISLHGRTYSVACAPGQETRIQGLAEQLDARVSQIEGAVGDIGSERLLLVAALGLLDELDVSRRAGPSSPQVEQQAAAALDKAAARIEAIAGRIESGA
jgi:cell division protein ZapA